MFYVGVLCSSLFWYAILYVISSFAIILTRKRELAALLLLSFGYLVTIHALWLFLTVPLVGLQFVIALFSDHAHFIKVNIASKSLQSPSDLFRST